MSKKKSLILLSTVFLALFVLITFILVINRNNSDSLGNNSTNTNSSSENGEVIDEKSDGNSLIINSENTYDKVFFEKEGNIFSRDINTNVEVQLSFYSENINSIKVIRVIDDNFLGFGKCDTVVGDYGCAIYTLDLTTKAIVERLRLNIDSLLMDLDFYEKDTFSYLYIEKTETTNRWIFAIEENGNTTLLENYEFEAFGRGGNPNDSRKIRFSEDGQRLFQISTESPLASGGSLFDSNIYVYDLISNSKKIISNATQPEWLNNDEIIYKGYYPSDVDLDGSLNVFNLESLTNKLLINEEIHHPKAITENMVIYSKTGGSLWMFELDSENETLIDAIAYDGSIISEKNILFTEFIDCTTREECESLEGSITRKVYNLESRNIRTLDDSWDNMNEITSAYD